VISVEDFDTFVNEVHGPTVVDGRGEPRRAFPWQSALLQRVLDEGWPATIDVPTGLGKTSVIDVAVFAAALRPDRAPHRMFFIVDRRLVVDEAFEHALRVQAALEQAVTGDATPIARQVAQAFLDRAVLDELSRPGIPAAARPLTVTRMRGGVTWDRLWVQRPDQFAIVTGTIDQIGSRLLFRGYGISEYARSIDAALVGADSLIVVDEAHLAQAFHTTVTAAFGMDTPALARPPVVVSMSATSQNGDERPHTITAADHELPTVAARLNAGKLLRLVEVSTTKKNAARDMTRTMAAMASRLADRGVVGVVCNTVGRARAVFTALSGGDAEVLLLTGRSRGIERDMLLARYYDRIRAGRDRVDTRPLIVVATQTIEVGANIDFDAAVIESTALPALIQRLGRLNRLGVLPAAAPAYLVHDSTTGTDDPIYGPSRLATWQWLTGLAPVGTPAAPDVAGLDVSPAALRRLRAQAPIEASAVPESLIPVLTRGILDEWTRTSPEPWPATPIAPFLHGIDSGQAPVTVVWRTGLPADGLEWWPFITDTVPPAAEESIDIPIGELRRWLLGQPTTDLADVDTPAPDPQTDDNPVPAGTPAGFRVRDAARRPLVLRYRGRGDSTLIPAGAIQPGDTIVIPGQYGGCDTFGWNPDSTTPVTDLADLAHRRHRTLLRLGPHLRHLIEAGTPAADRLVQLLDYAGTDPEAGRPAGYRPLLAALGEALDDGHPLRRVIDGLATPTLTAMTTRYLDTDTGRSWQPDFPIVLAAQLAWHADEESEAATSASAYPGRRITLDDHERAVAARARQIASNLHLPEQVVTTIAWAALYLPRLPSGQFRRHVRIREGCRRDGHVGGCSDG
jgi:CRISPR-associated endonuclease/helicase Cas3